MKSESILDINSINPLNVCSYLRIMGWEPEEYSGRPYLRYFHHPDDVYAQLELPFDCELPGFTRSMEEVIFRLAEFEGRNEPSIISDLINAEDDTIRYRIQSQQSLSGNISLIDAQELISNVVQTLKASVCDVVSPQKFHPRLRRREVDTLLDNVRFAQTERGSYVVKILCPVYCLESQERSLLESESKPLARRVTKHLMESVSRIVRSVELGQVPQFIDSVRKNINETSMSANFCRAVADMQVLKESSVEISANWAPLLPCEDSRRSCTVKIKRNYFDSISEIADAVLPSPQEIGRETFIAVVDECRGAINQTGEREGEVILDLLTSEGEHLRVNADLNPEQYKIANSCHIKGEEHYLTIKGTIVRKKRSHKLTNIDHITPVQ